MKYAMAVPLSAVCAIALAPPSSASAQCEYTVGGTVYRDCDEPLTTGEQDVEVCVDCDGGFNACTTTSGGWGGWMIEDVPCGTCTVTLEKAGLVFCRVTDECPPDPCVHPIGITVDADHEEENMSLGFYGIGVCEITGSDPPACAIDARQPHEQDDPDDRYGWDWVDITFDCDSPNVGPEDFLVTQTPDALPSPPQIDFVTDLGGGTVRLQLTKPINPGNWTCFELAYDSDEQVCLGYLPADADANREVNPRDILHVIDCLNAVAACQEWQCDTDRNAECEADDIVQMIRLLDGTNSFSEWLGKTLPACPSAE